MESLGAVGRLMPLYASLPLAALYTVLTILAIRRESSRALQFLLFAIAFRYMVSAFHTYTFKSSPIGLSWTALCTLSAFGIGMLIIRKRRLMDPAVISVAPLMLVIAISGFVNSDIPGMVGVLAKYGYFTVLILTMVDAIEDVGVDKTFRALLLPLSIPFVFQIVSIPLGVIKASEADGSASYIGGFPHESGLSICLATALMALCFIRSISAPVKAALVAWCTVAILLANYRTSIVAMAPLLAIAFMTGVTRRFIPRQRPLVMGLMIVSVAVAGSAAMLEKGDRYTDVLVVLQKGTDIIKPPRDFTIEDRKLLSGRAMIWSRYVYAYYDGTPLQRVVGFGAESWQGRFIAYAHNTFVSTLYELGIMGMIAMIFLFVRMFGMALTGHSEHKPRIIAAHIGFVLLAMATMPLWSVEGLIMYGLLCGYTVYAAGQRKSVSAAGDESRESSAAAPVGSLPVAG